MPAANHAFYLRNCYLENRLAKGEMELAGVTLDLKKVKVPIFNLATKEDHIAPARSVFLGSKAFGGPVDYVLAGSGHIAGVVNSAEQAEIPVLDRRPGDRRTGRLDEERAPRRRAPGGRTGSNGSRPRLPAWWRAEAGKRQAEAARGCAGHLRSDEVVKRSRSDNAKRKRPARCRPFPIFRIVETISTCARSEQPGWRPSDRPSDSGRQPR